uniref:Uncharacterized protein n=1 Tax=Rhizophora mucronata TaxID=61149 RepID=A0A2P2KPU0_RHIMU
MCRDKAVLLGHLQYYCRVDGGNPFTGDHISEASCGDATSPACSSKFLSTPQPEEGLCLRTTVCTIEIDLLLVERMSGSILVHVKQSRLIIFV